MADNVVCLTDYCTHVAIKNHHRSKNIKRHKPHVESHMGEMRVITVIHN